MQFRIYYEKAVNAYFTYMYVIRHAFIWRVGASPYILFLTTHYGFIENKYPNTYSENNEHLFLDI